MLTVAIDFDGVIYRPSPDDTRVTLCGSPMPGVIEFIAKVREAGFDVVIHSLRATNYEGTRLALEWMFRNGFPPLGFVANKPPALIYIDDKGYRFTGDWEGPWRIIEEWMRENKSNRSGKVAG